MYYQAKWKRLLIFKWVIHNERWSRQLPLDHRGGATRFRPQSLWAQPHQTLSDSNEGAVLRVVLGNSAV